MQCNICGNDTFGPQANRPNARCQKCGSLERTRALKLHLDRLGLPRKGDRILHFAPEMMIAKFLKERAGDGYEPVDLYPNLFKGLDVRKFDLCADAEALVPNTYDCIIHSHVLEHIPCNWTMVLLFLHRALRPGGHHIMCFPILGGSYEESLAPMTGADAVKRFGQDDHVRRFAAADLSRTLGMVFRGNLADHKLSSHFDAPTLNAVNIPANMSTTLNSSTVFVFGKYDARVLT